MTRLVAWPRRHYWFIALLLLFVAMRLLAILLFRPGGFFADNSDYDFYILWGEQIPKGYTTFQNLWTAYPPLFAALMLPVFEFSSRIPPWVEPDLAFHVLFGGLLLLFETGNLILIYRLGNRLEDTGGSRSSSEESSAGPHASASPAFMPLRLPAGILPATLYALLFAPIYTLLGWFEAMPLFFLLLGLDLLLVPRRWGWLGSAVAAALGFLVKLTPVLLLPVAVRWLGARLSLDALRREWFNRRSRGNLLRPALYTLVFAAVTLLVGWLALGPGFDPALAFSSFRVNAIRPPWQSVWALIDGYYGYGLVPVNMLNLGGLAGGYQWQTRIPWGVVGLLFAALYLWLYTRRYDWGRPRTPVVFTAVSVIWLFLYSKGWSPQFVVWVLAFLVLLTPSMHGIVLAIALTAINFVESTLFLLVLPNEHWLLVGTVLARTLLLLLLAAEWLGQIWPAAPVGRKMGQWAARAGWGVVAVALVAGLAGAPRMAQAYWERRSAEHPCREAIAVLQQQAAGPRTVIVTDQIEVWRDLYPWLRQEYTIHVLDGYDPDDRPAVAVMGEKLAPIAAEGEFWWVERADGAQEQPETPTASHLPALRSPVITALAAQPGVSILDVQSLGDCRLGRVVTLPPDAALATVETAGGPITLLATAVGEVQENRSLPQNGQILPLVLYWRAEEPVAESYTVFTQLLDGAGNLVAQQDNLPVEGLAPTDTWQPGLVIRDPYHLALPAGAAPGAYRLLVGMYDGEGRRTLRLADGSAADHLELTVTIR